MVTEPCRLAVLLSGRGSNLLAIHTAVERGDLPARLSLVISNRSDAPGLIRARELGLEAASIPLPAVGGRAAHERQILAALRNASVEWVCLAGYMRLLSPSFVECFPQRIVNIHPSLLPAFPGRDAQRQALEYGVRFTGCTVHLADAGLDSGSIVDQRVVPVLPADTLDQLTQRILAQEHELYPSALRRLLTEAWEVQGRRVMFAGEARTDVATT